MTLEEALSKILGSGVMGVAAFYLVNTLVIPLRERLRPFMEKHAWLLGIEVFIVRGVAWVLSGLLAFIPYWFSTVMGYVEAPGDWRGWLEGAFPFVVIAITTGQATHAIDKGCAEARRVAAA